MMDNEIDRELLEKIADMLGKPVVPSTSGRTAAVTAASPRSTFRFWTGTTAKPVSTSALPTAQ